METGQGVITEVYYQSLVYDIIGNIMRIDDCLVIYDAHNQAKPLTSYNLLYP